MLTRTVLYYVNPVNDIYECFQIVCNTTHVLIKNIKQACFHLESTLSPIKPLPDLIRPNRTLDFGLASTRSPSTKSERVTHLHIPVPAITRGTLARPK